MINVEIFKDKGNYIGYKVSGHAYSDEYGKDIICASASILAQTTLVSLDEVSNSNPSFTIDDDEGLLDVRFEFPSDEILQVKLNALMDSFSLGMNGIAEMYPDYINVSVREVQSDDNQV